jgi:uncharacterized protein (DUF1501 family)
MFIRTRHFGQSRREFLRAGLYALGVSCGLPPLLEQVSLAQTARVLAGEADPHSSRILVAVELTGGNDGLNTVVPYADDAYHRARPRLGIRERQVLKLDDRFGLNPSCAGFERLFKDGKLAIVHGCGYPNPNLSYFTAMEWWHTAAPHRNEPYGWLGRYADARWPEPCPNGVVNIGPRQSRAVTAASNSPLVFADPRKLGREGTEAQQKVFETFGTVHPTSNSTLEFVNKVANSTMTGAALVKHACAEYGSLVDYGSGNNLTLDLKKVAAMIKADLPTRIYYLSLGGFDTHAAQNDIHNLLLVYLSDALRGFCEDVERIGRGDEVAVMLFTEFGRRVQENASRGTDHGTATPMLILGKPVHGGLYGQPPSLTDLVSGNLRMTTDFRSVYATLLRRWMGFGDTRAVLKGEFETLPVFR